MAWILEPTAMETGASICLHTEMAMPRGPQKFLGLDGFHLRKGLIYPWLQLCTPSGSSLYWSQGLALPVQATLIHCEAFIWTSLTWTVSPA